MPDTDAPSSRIAWEPWTAAACARAAAERRPVLLSLTASWCHGCDVMDAVTYADPRVGAAVAESFVPVRVDTDRRPDVNSRYNLDGWPTTALLTPGGEILTGSTYLTPDAMLVMLETTRTAFAGRYDELMARADQAARLRRGTPPSVRYEPDGEAPRWLASRMLDEEDREHGGFGAGGKFLPSAPMRLALSWSATARDERVGALAARTLDAVCWGGLFDEVDGGLFRYAANRDFTRPHTEKLLEDQAAFVPVLLDATGLTRGPAYRQRAADIMRYVQRTLFDAAAGAFFASQCADDEYYALSGSIRATMDPPRVDRTAFTDLNAQAIVAWLHAARSLEDADLERIAVRAADRVLVPAFEEDQGFRHWDGPGAPSCLLGDQIHGVWALLHLSAATRRPEYLALADRAMGVAIRRLWDARNGGFFDRAMEADDVGLLRDSRKPLALNSLAARALSRLEEMTGTGGLKARARETLGALTANYRADGLGAAPYALAVLEVAGEGP